MKEKLAVAILSLAVFIAGFLVHTTPQPKAGSVSVSNEYSRVNIATNGAYGATTTPNVAGISGGIKVGAGSLGSVVITGAAAGVLNFYDATTSDVSKRTGNKATSTILLANLPASLVAGTYIFDAAFNYGLFYELNTGTAPTTTVTFR